MSGAGAVDTLVPSHHFPVVVGSALVVGQRVVVECGSGDSRYARSGRLYVALPYIEVVGSGFGQGRPRKVGLLVVD